MGGRDVCDERIAREGRNGHGSFRTLAHPELVARTLIETIAFWAMHRHFDPSPQAVDDEQAQTALIDLLLHGLTE